MLPTNLKYILQFHLRLWFAHSMFPLSQVRLISFTYNENNS